jgi:sn-glycerol 3-phosphate transport system substrate-binding protein
MSTGSLVLSALLVIPLAAHAAPAAAQAKPGAAAKKPAEASQPAGEVELMHQLGADKGEELQKLVARFNAANPGYKVTVSERDWRKGELPHMLILQDADETDLLAGKSRIRPLHQVMREAGEKLVTFSKAPAQMNLRALDAAGKLQALPVAMSTPLMFYNKDAFKKAGLNPDEPPKTWWNLQQALGQLYDQGVRCPYTSAFPSWIHVENMSAWHNEPFTNAVPGRAGPLAVNGMVQVKHLAMMSSWYKSQYMHIFGRNSEAEARFLAGECAVLTTASGAYPTLARNAKFGLGVSSLPYHDDIRGAPQNTLADGPSLWITAGHKPTEYKAVAKFVSFLLTPEMQVEWQQHMGYLPLNRAGVLAASSQLLKDELINNRIAIQQLTYKPVTSTSGATRLAERTTVQSILDEELEALWANKKPAKEVLDTAVARSRSSCARC